MGSFRRFITGLGHTTQLRRAGRSHLKAAKKENREQFLSLVSGYIDLAHAFYGSTLAEPVELRRERVTSLFLELWRNLRYAERLSDFEYMLATALIENAPIDGPISSPEPMVTKVRMLAPRVRFALLAYEFEKWPIRWVKLVMRMRPSQLHRLLSEARCELCGVSWESLALEERNCLEAISSAMDDCTNIEANKVVCERIKTFPRVSEIKAEWLEMRPELVEVRLRYIPEQAERETVLSSILNAISGVPMQRPPLVDRVVNSVHFSRHEKIQVS